MAKSAQTFESEIQPLIRDRTGGTVESSDVRAALNRGIRTLINDHGIYATKNRAILHIFPSVYEYPLESDFHDIITVYDRGTPVKFTKKTPSDFYLRLNQENNLLAIDTILGDRYLLCKYSTAGGSTVVHNCDSLTADGTWAADTSLSDALNLTSDVLDKKVGSASVNFDVDVSQTGYDCADVYCSGMTAVDASEHEDKGTLFFWLYIPDSTYISSVSVRWGSDSSNYWSGSATSQFNGQDFRDGWNRIGVSWTDTSETGSPDSSALTYVWISVIFTSSQTDDTDFRLDDIRIETPSVMEISYYSSRFVKASDGTLQDTFITDDDESLLADADDDLLFYFALLDCLWIKDRAAEMPIAEVRFRELLDKVKARYASERKRESVRYI